MKYLGFPLPELEIIYPICAKGCRKIRDAEILEDIRYMMFAILFKKSSKFMIILGCKNPLFFSILYWYVCAHVYTILYI